jgi:hypothetical protein
MLEREVTAVSAAAAGAGVDVQVILRLVATLASQQQFAMSIEADVAAGHTAGTRRGEKAVNHPVTT